MFIPSIIKSIQRGTITLSSGVLSNTLTVTAVDTNYSRVKLLGLTSSDTGVQNPTNFARIDLTNSTTITATRKSGTATDLVLSVELIEYYPAFVKSIQRGTIDLASATSNTSTISSVVTGKTELDFLGIESIDNENDMNYAYVDLTNATTVTAHRVNGGSSNTSLAGYQAVEFR